MVLASHVDAAVLNRHVAEWIIRNAPDIALEDFEFSQNVVGRAQYRFALADRPGLVLFRDDFNRELDEMRKDGRFEAILDKYR